MRVLSDLGFIFRILFSPQRKLAQHNTIYMDNVKLAIEVGQHVFK